MLIIIVILSLLFVSSLGFMLTFKSKYQTLKDKFTKLDSFIKDVESPLRKGYYREKGWTQGNIKFDVIIFVSEIDRYKNGESRIKLDSVEIDVDKGAFNYNSAYNFAKNTFLTLRKTADIEWLESENEIRELRKSKLEHLKGALNNE